MIIHPSVCVKNVICKSFIVEIIGWLSEYQRNKNFHHDICISVCTKRSICTIQISKHIIKMYNVSLGVIFWSVKMLNIYIVPNSNLMCNFL